MDQTSQQPLVYPVNMTDHDLLIRLDQKMSQLSLDVGKTNDGLTARLAVIEAKLIAYDQILVEYDPKKNMAMLLGHDEWIRNYKLTARILLLEASVIGSFATGVIIWLLNVLKIISFVHGNK